MKSENISFVKIQEDGLKKKLTIKSKNYETKKNKNTKKAVVKTSSPKFVVLNVENCVPKTVEHEIN